MSTNALSSPYPVQLTQATFSLEYHIFEALLNTTDNSVIQYLQLHLPQLQQSEVQQWLSEQEILIDATTANFDSQLAPGQMLTINLRNHFEQEVNTQWQTLWQNDEILAAFKPAPLAVSRTTRNLHNTLISLVRRETPFVKAQLLHRLDIETSGLILLAKDQQSDVKWKKGFQQLIEKKVYHAIVKGVPDWQEHLCENQLAERIDSAIRCKMYVVDPTEPIESYKKPKACKSIFKCLKTQGEYSLIECRIFTGRKHQIRAQLAALGLPIVGDKIYSHQGHFFLKRLQLENGLIAADYKELGAKNHLLRAVELQLRLSPEQDLVKISCPSFAQDLSLELYNNIDN